jgi:hypothetical protein
MKLIKMLDVEELRKSKIIKDVFLISKTVLELNRILLEITEKVS